MEKKLNRLLYIDITISGSSALFMNVWMYDWMHDFWYAWATWSIILKASSLFAQLFALLPAIVIAPFITVYVWL